MKVSCEYFITLKFYNRYYYDDRCSIDRYGVGIKPNTCFRHGSYTAKLSCSASGLESIVYTTSDCSGYGNIKTISTVIGTCARSAYWTSNEFFQDPDGAFIITCSEDEYWVANNVEYTVSRTAHSLDSFSAIDYRQDTCAGCQGSPPITYAYTTQCHGQPDSGVGLLYFPSSSLLETEVYMYDASCSNYQGSETIKYRECVRCSKFYFSADDYWTDNSENDAATNKLATTTIIVIIVCSIIGCLCIFAIPILLCGGGAAILAALCCKDKKNASITNVTTPELQMGYANSYTRKNDVSYADSYSQKNDTPQQMSINPGLELVTIQIPPSVPPDGLITVMKSNGQAVQFQVPPNAPPGSQVQVYL